MSAGVSWPGESGSGRHRVGRVAAEAAGAAMLGRLGVAQRQVLVASYFRRRTVTDAAEELGMSTARAKSLLYDAMRTLSATVTEDAWRHPAADRVIGDRAPICRAHGRP